VTLFALTIAAAVLLAVTGADRVWRAALFIPFFVAATGFYQAREKT
jgi:hypothetical protein